MAIAVCGKWHFLDNTVRSDRWEATVNGARIEFHFLVDETAQGMCHDPIEVWSNANTVDN